VHFSMILKECDIDVLTMNVFYLDLKILRIGLLFNDFS